MSHAFAEPATERMARRALSLNEAGVAAEDILIAWLVGLPDGADVPREAAQLVARLDGLDAAPGAAGAAGSDDGRLRDLLREVAESATARIGIRGRSRNRWRN